MLQNKSQIENEEKIQKNLERFINENKSFIFNAGAGKTYSLIKLLEYITSTKGEELKKNNQNIICITYTNIAKQEIENRIGKNNLLLVSTIHERVWEWIGKYEKELREIHKEKIKEEIKKIKEKQEYVPEEVGDLEDVINNKDFIKNYYKIKKLKKEEFLEKLGKEINLKIKVRKKIECSIEGSIKIKKYLEALKNKDAKVEYDSEYPYDRLDKYLISHETLLEYGKQMLEKNKILNQIIIDKSPIIMVDEYQDTSPNVIEMMLSIAKNKSEKQNFTIGYFGDKAQNIYDKSIGNKLIDYYKKKYENIEEIKKIYNRRSKINIIEITNTIRNDDVEQVSINPNLYSGGSFEFYSLGENNREKIDLFIEAKRKEFGEVQILFLTNKLKAKYLGVKNIYEVLKNTPYYKKKSNDLISDIFNKEKSNGVLKLFYEIYQYLKFFKEKDILISNLIDEKNVQNLSLNILNDYYSKIKILIEKVKFEDLKMKEAFKQILEMFDIETDIVLKVKKYIKKEFNYFDLEEDYSYENFEMLIKKMLEIEEQETLFQLMSINFLELEKQIEILEKNNIFSVSTYHGTKGDEFKNIIIIMENKFGRANKFKNYFLAKKVEEELNEENQNTQNLIYVAVSRAKENVKILYIDDISEFQEGIKKTFGIKEIKIW